MKKTIVSWALMFVMCLSLCIPVFATDVNHNSVNSIDATKIDVLQQRADQARAQAIQARPAAVALANDDVDQLTAVLANVLGEIDRIEANEISIESETRLNELQVQKNSLETQLATHGVLVLTDDDLSMLFGENTQINISIDELDQTESGVAPRSASSQVMWPISTQYALWTYSGLQTGYSKPCYYVQATPKDGATQSTLYNIRDQYSIERPYGKLTKATAEFCTSMVAGAVGNVVGSTALGSAFGVAASSSTVSTSYEYEFEEVLSVRFVYVYSSADDEYYQSLITQSDSIVYSHRAFGKGWKSANPVVAPGNYYDSPFNRAISNFNSGTGIVENDRYRTYTAQIKYNDGSKERLAQFVPIYVSSMTMVN